MSKRLTIIILLVLLLVPWGASEAQDGGISCPDLVARALEVVSSSCADLDRNQACYGHDTVMATLLPEVADVAFSSPSDRVDVAYIRNMTTSPMNLDTGEWGVAVMKIQADIPDTIPGQAVTFILYGDVRIQDAGGSSPMQAFYFTTGLGEPMCREAPPSALVIQSPEGRTVTLNINGAEVSLSSSVALTAVPGSQMTITTLHGVARAEINDVRTLAPAGFRVSVPLGGDDGLTAEPPVVPPMPEDPSRWEALESTPPDLLEMPIEVPREIDPDLLEEFGQICGDGICHISEFGWCDEDCAGLPEPDHHVSVCGDGVCGYDEFGVCEEDCGPLPECGDGVCEPGEEFICPADCEAELQDVMDRWWGSEEQQAAPLPESCYEEWTAECDAWIAEIAPEGLPESCYREWTEECDAWLEGIVSEELPEGLPESCYQEWTEECDAWLEGAMPEELPEGLPESCYQEWSDECDAWMEQFVPTEEPEMAPAEGEEEEWDESMDEPMDGEEWDESMDEPMDEGEPPTDEPTPDGGW